jgi:ribosomal protein S18 acetylase RimI-like enzyme
MEYIYRTGTSSDIQHLKELGLIAYGQFKDILAEGHWNKMTTFLAGENLYSELLQKSKCFVCDTGNKIVGMAYLIPAGNPTDIFDHNWSYIRMVGVHPDFGGKGIGKKLTQLCIDFARESNEKTVALHTSEFMDAARHIYESLGFKQVKQLDQRYGKKYWLYLLEL